MAQGHRAERVADQIREDMSQLLARDVHDPGIGFITITRVSVSPDLGFARVYYTTMRDAAGKRETAKALKRAAPFLRRQIGARLGLRRVPELDFAFDAGVEHQDRVERLLQEIHANDEAAAAHTHPDGQTDQAAGDDDHSRGD
jgi:ribosome-binding factor A